MLIFRGVKCNVSKYLGNIDLGIAVNPRHLAEHDQHQSAYRVDGEQQQQQQQQQPQPAPVLLSIQI